MLQMRRTSCRTPPRYRLCAHGLSLALAITGATVTGVEAQSEYHWSDQFGNRSTLLNGTMIGSVSDLGAVFYNPGRLAQLDRPGFLITAEAIEWNTVKIESGTGEDLELEQDNFRFLPSIVAGLFSLPFLEGHKFAYSILARRKSETDLHVAIEAQEDLIAPLPGEEHYLGAWESEGKLTETWVGITWAHEISPKISLGVSTFGTYLGRNQRIELDVRTVPVDGDPFILIRSRDYRSDSYGVLWKAGVAADFEPFRAGLSITTPRITLFGDGSIRFEDLLTVPDPAVVDPGVVPRVTGFHEEELDVSSHTPWAIGGGVSWVAERFVFHVSGEWYAGVPQYQVMAADTIRSQSSGELTEYRVMDELKAVFNFGTGLEWQVSDALSAYGSVAWDHSSAPEDPLRPFAFGDSVSVSTAQADAIRLGTGASLETRWIDLTAGFSFGSTKETLGHPLIAADSGLPGPIPAGAELALRRDRWRFLLGFSIPYVGIEG